MIPQKEWIHLLNRNTDMNGMRSLYELELTQHYFRRDLKAFWCEDELKGDEEGIYFKLVLQISSSRICRTKCRRCSILIRFPLLFYIVFLLIRTLLFPVLAGADLSLLRETRTWVAPVFGDPCSCTFNSTRTTSRQRSGVNYCNLNYRALESIEGKLREFSLSTLHETQSTHTCHTPGTTHVLFSF